MNEIPRVDKLVEMITLTGTKRNAEMVKDVTGIILSKNDHYSSEFQVVRDVLNFSSNDARRAVKYGIINQE